MIILEWKLSLSEGETEKKDRGGEEGERRELQARRGGGLRKRVREKMK